MENCLSLAKSFEFDIDHCIICQKKGKVSLTSTENGRKKIIDAAAIRKDEVYQRLQNGNIDRNFKYHVTNSCLKNYKLKNTSESLSVSSISWIYAINYHLSIVYIFKHG